jgi:signal transduction histidine kinase
MIISSIVLTARESFFQTSFALILIGILAFLEFYSILPHYPLEGFINTNMYNNLTYIISTGIIFISTSYFIMFITGNIVRESKKHELANLKANFELRQKDKIKDEYVMRITHDIKGHINAIQSCNSVLHKKLAGPLNPVQEEYVNRSSERIKLLNNFISDLLNITKRKLELKSEKKYFNLKDSLEEVLKTIENSANDKNISIIKNIDVSDQNIFGEKSSIEEVLTNLLTNAIKYSASGQSVLINVIDKIDKILIEVVDKGVGIPEKEIDQLFTEFFRASNVKNEIKDGTGLGLSISKQIVEDHGGKIWVESILYFGTTFSVLLNKNQV